VRQKDLLGVFFRLFGVFFFLASVASPERAGTRLFSLKKGKRGLLEKEKKLGKREWEMMWLIKIKNHLF
jgi:hypothetical protein